MLYTPIQLQSFDNTQISMPKESESIGGQSYPSWEEFKEKYMARMNKVKPNLAGNSADNFTTPTLEELPTEYRQAYKTIEKKREEEDMQMFCATLKKNPTSTPYHNDHVEPSALERQEGEALQASQDKVDSTTTLTLTNEAGSCNSVNAKSNKQRNDNSGSRIDYAE